MGKSGHSQLQYPEYHTRFVLAHPKDICPIPLKGCYEILSRRTLRHYNQNTRHVIPMSHSRSAFSPAAARRIALPSQAAKTSSNSQTSTKSIFRRILDGISSKSRARSHARQCMTLFRPNRWAANTFSLIPPTGNTRPRSVTSPVIATSSRTQRPVNRDIRAVVTATPAEGPSLGMAPAGR